MKTNRTPEQMTRLTPCRVRRFADCASALTEMRLLMDNMSSIRARVLTPEQMLRTLRAEVECRARNVIRQAESVLAQHGEDHGHTWEESNDLLRELNDLFYLVPDGPENTSDR